MGADFVGGINYEIEMRGVLLMEFWLNAISSIGFPSVFAMFLIYQGYKDKQDYNKRIEEKDKDNRVFTNERIAELREEIKEIKMENKEDKKLFEMSVNTFSKTVEKMDVLIKDVNEIKQDVKSLNKEINDIKEEK